MPASNLHIGAVSTHATEDITIQTSGGNVAIGTGAEDGAVMITGEGQAGMQSGQAILELKNVGAVEANAILTVGELGSVQLGCGIPLIGTSIKLEPEAVIITCGVPGVGASIKMTPESITFQVAEVTFTLTPLGIMEEVAECSREHTPQGHNLTAAETEFNVGVQGETKALPTEESEVEAGAVKNETMGSHTSDAMRNDDAGVMMTV